MSFSCKKLVVIGAGLIGGSLIKALKKKQCDIGEIVAVGRNQDVLLSAKKAGIIDGCSNNTSDAVIGADVVVVATPVGAMERQFQAMYKNLSDNCVVTDVGSVKAKVVAIARASLKDKIKNFIPGHPVSGTEHSGFNASFADLFEDRHTVITRLDENSAENISKVKNMWITTGSHILDMNIETHDRIFAATSHLPHVLVYALMNTIMSLPNSEKYFQVVAGGFLDYTRIASSDAVMWRDICLSNQKPILEMLSKYKDQLTDLEDMIKNQKDDALFSHFAKAKCVRDELVKRRQKEKQTDL